MSLPIKLPREAANYESHPFEYNGMLYEPVYREGTVKRYKAELNNLYISLHPSRKEITVQNSLHVFRQGNNAADFTLSDFGKAVQQLSDIIGHNMFDAKPTKLEYGCNFITGSSSPFYENLVEYGGRPYQPMIQGKDYGKKSNATQYAIKAYGKAEMLKIRDGKGPAVNTERFEIEAKKMQYIKTIKAQIVTVRDLLDYENAQIFANDLESKYTNSVKDMTVDYDSLSPSEGKIFAAMKNDSYRANLRVKRPDIYRYQKGICNKILREYVSDNSLRTAKLLREKLTKLINS